MAFQRTARDEPGEFEESAMGYYGAEARGGGGFTSLPEPAGGPSWADIYADEANALQRQYNLRYPTPAGAPAATAFRRSARVGYEEYEGAPMQREPPSRGLGSQGFFIPSGKGGGGRGGGENVPGYAYPPGYQPPGGAGFGFMPPPAAPTIPAFTPPPFDTSKIESKAQRIAGPGIRELRRSIREAQGRRYENPNVRRTTLRDALSGYGLGLERVLGGARERAGAEYTREYQPEFQAAMASYQTQQQAAMTAYQNAWRDYLGRFQTITT